MKGLPVMWCERYNRNYIRGLEMRYTRRQSERNKVLDEVRTRLSKLKTKSKGADFVWWLVIDTALNELRQAGEQG